MAIRRIYLLLNALLVRNYIFFSTCFLLFVALSLTLPPFFPLIQPDSDGYIQFAPSRTALYPLFLNFFMTMGLSLVEITYVQLALVSLALIVLLAALLRAGVPRMLIVLFVLGLACNSYFST